MYTRHNHHKHVRQHIAPKNTAHCHCQCMSHTMTQKSYKMHPPSQHTRHVSHTRRAYHPRRNKFTNVECFYCMTKGHTSNVCFYRRLHLNLLPLDYLKTHKPRPNKAWVQKVVWWFCFSFLPLIDKLIKLIYLAYQ